MTVLEVAVYLAYLVPTMALFLRPARVPASASGEQAPSAAAALGEPAR
jgi:hypothetical protein